jgi:hypothetical protein
MKKSSVSVLLLSAFLMQSVFAEEERSVPQRMGDTVKKGGEAAGRGIEKGAKAVGHGLKKGGEATVKGVKHAEGWVGKKMEKGGEKLEKASK